MTQSISLQAIQRLQQNALKIVHRKLSQKSVLQEVSSVFDISPHMLLSRSTADQVVVPRSVAFLFSMLIPGHTLKMTGLDYGGRDHSTVVHGLKAVVREYEINRQFRAKVDRIRIRFEISEEIFELHINRWRR